jgi:hypothetical protein
MSSTSTPTRQARVPAPIVQKQRHLATDIPNRSLSAAKKQETYNAEIQVKAHLGPQVGKRVISPALPASPLPVPVHTAPTRQRTTRQPILNKFDDISEKAAKYQYKAKQKREEEEKKAAKKAVEKEKKKAAKEKKTEGKARRGSKREMVSEEQVRTKRAKLERKSSQ